MSLFLPSLENSCTDLLLVLLLIYSRILATQLINMLLKFIAGINDLVQIVLTGDSDTMASLYAFCKFRRILVQVWPIICTTVCLFSYIITILLQIYRSKCLYVRFTRINYRIIFRDRLCFDYVQVWMEWQYIFVLSVAFSFKFDQFSALLCAYLVRLLPFFTNISI